MRASDSRLPNDLSTPALRRAGELLAAPRPDLGWHSTFGQTLAEAQVGEAGRPLSGRELARRLGVSVAQIQQHLRAVELFNPAELPETPLTWAVVVALSAVQDPVRRRDLFRAAVAGRWSSQRVRREVRMVQPARRPPIRRRRATPDLQPFWAMVDAARELASRYALWVEQLPPDGPAGLLTAYLAEGEGTGPDRGRQLRDAHRTLRSADEAVEALGSAIRGALRR